MTDPLVTLDRDQSLAGVVVEMWLGWPSFGQLRLASAVLTRGRRVWLYWPQEEAVECVDRERIGRGEEPDTDVGPLISEAQRARVEDLVAEAMERGGRLAAMAQVTDSLLDRCKPIAGTPDDCIAAIEEYRDAGCTHVMLELWGDDRHEQIRLFGEKVLPHFRQ